VTWSPAATPERQPTGLRRALATAAEAIGPPLADLAVAGVMRLLERQVLARPVRSSYQRYLPSARRELPPPDRAR
jgi:hypothetical protein